MNNASDYGYSIAGQTGGDPTPQERHMKLHPSITSERIIAAVESEMFGLENPGFCIACGADAEGCEPDARKLTCESCGAHAVYGAQELLF